MLNLAVLANLVVAVLSVMAIAWLDNDGTGPTAHDITRLTHHLRVAHHRLRHTRLHHHWLLVAHAHHLLRCHVLNLTSQLLDRSANRFDRGRGPDTLQVHLTRLLSLVLNGEPVVDTTIHAQRAQLDCCLSDEVARRDIFIIHRDCHVIANVFDVDVEDLVPLGCLTGALESSGAHLLLSGFDLAPWVHLAEPFSITRQLCFDDAQTQLS